MTIVLIDADAGFRSKFKNRLERITGVNVVGESSNAYEAAAMILNRKPDVAIINSTLEGSTGLDAIRQIKQLMAPPTIIIFTEDLSPDNKTACSLAGADFFFDKATDDHSLIDRLRLLRLPHNRTKSSDASSPC